MAKPSGFQSLSSVSLSDLIMLIQSAGITDSKVTVQALLNSIFGGQLQTYTPTTSGLIGCTASSQIGYYINLGGIKLCWGSIGVASTAAQSHVGITMPTSFFSSVQTYIPSIMAEGSNAYQTISGDNCNTTQAAFYIGNTSNGGSATCGWLVIGT